MRHESRRSASLKDPSRQADGGPPFSSRPLKPTGQEHKTSWRQSRTRGPGRARPHQQIRARRAQGGVRDSHLTTVRSHTGTPGPLPSRRPDGLPGRPPAARSLSPRSTQAGGPRLRASTYDLPVLGQCRCSLNTTSSWSTQEQHLWIRSACAKRSARGFTGSVFNAVHTKPPGLKG